MPQKIRKTSWASIFHRIIPEGKIASVTGERQVQDENSEAASGDESIVAKRRAKPISPTSTEQEDEPCQTTTVTKPKETITRLVCKRNQYAKGECQLLRTRRNVIYYMSIEIYVKYAAEIEFVFQCILYFSHVKKVVSAL